MKTVHSRWFDQQESIHASHHAHGDREGAGNSNRNTATGVGSSINQGWAALVATASIGVAEIMRRRPRVPGFTAVCRFVFRLRSLPGAFASIIKRGGDDWRGMKPATLALVMSGVALGMTGLTPLSSEEQAQCLGAVENDAYYLPAPIDCISAMTSGWEASSRGLEDIAVTRVSQWDPLAWFERVAVSSIAGDVHAQGLIRPRFEPGNAEDWLGLVDVMSLEYDLEPALLLAVMEQESAFDDRAVSHAGARGLMQVLPEGAEAEARQELGLDQRLDLFDPAMNVLIGSWYLDRQRNRYAAHVEEPLAVALALAAYNWGPSRVDRHLLTDRPPANFKELRARLDARAPLETRNYVYGITERLPFWADWYKQ